MNENKLKEYARLICEVGVNIQKGQDVRINVSIEHHKLAELIVEKAYEMGARKAVVKWNDDVINRLNLINQSIETLSEVNNELEGMYKDDLERFPVNIHILSSDPDVYKGIDINKLTEPRKNRYPLLKKYIDEIDSVSQWVIVAMPSVPWAKKMYPALSDDEAYNKLEEAILKTMRMNEGDSFENWKQHTDSLNKHAEILNKLDIDELHYTSGNGTDFRVKKHPEAVFSSAEMKMKNGHICFANMPSEELFTLPLKDSANGIVYATKPLSYNGNLIENFSVRFENGKAVKVKAEKGIEHLEEMIRMDDGSAYLGEIALVPYDSPINQIGSLFYNTLFDENASCHIALGDGVADTIKGYENYSKDELKEMGCNDSMIHVDFMVGDKDTRIEATTKDGKTVTLFENGLWAI